ncbi:MAG: HD domain-containing protein [Myxococcota bacterium]
MKDILVDLLDDLDGVAQDPVWHPEGDALFHSLQVYALACAETHDPELMAAALLHDVGKGLPGAHEIEGARLLEGLISDRVVWLVRHHLDLLRAPRRTRRRLRGTERLRDLERLRRWDVGGRDPDATVGTVEDAVDSLLEALSGLR